MYTNQNQYPQNEKTKHSDGYYIGIMGGTSLDGLDLVLCRFEPLMLLATHTVPFPQALHAVLRALCLPNGIDMLDKSALGSYSKAVSELDYFGQAAPAYAKLCASAVQQLLTKAQLQASAIIAIGVHGQTVRHRPELGFSLQLIDANALSEQLGILVISDFRRRDMAAGGQGAPLVPAFHRYLYGQTVNHACSNHELTAFLNLGGIANITLLHADRLDSDASDVLGYDTGPANLLLDLWAQKHLQTDFDAGGQWASGGLVQSALLQRLLQHPFLAKSAPKSTGREQFNEVWLDGILQEFAPMAPQDVQATLCEFSAKSIADAISYHGQGGMLYVCGGGAYNDYLLSRIAHYLPAWCLASTQVLGLAPTWVEAACFAWLARQYVLALPSNLPAVTGAARAVVLGMASPA